MALALILTTVSPEVGGVLVRGEKGTAKSTMVRALTELLPEQRVVAHCRFGCDPESPDALCPDGPHDAESQNAVRPARLVELPVGATEDRVIGSLDLSRALGAGETAFEPGLLASANRGLLYVDEVNLLHDHLVDLLLDAAAMGRNTVERDGVSVSHAARIVLVGTMNPEEGELRPQLLDRFGLTVEIAASREPSMRADVVRRRLAFDADPQGFATTFAGDQDALRARISAARALLPEVCLSEWAMLKIATVCAGFEVDGMRADIVTARAACAHAAWDSRTSVTRADIRVAARLALPHRRRRNPFDAPGLDEALLDRLLGDGPDGDGADDDDGDRSARSPEPDGEGSEGQPEASGTAEAPPVPPAAGDTGDDSAASSPADAAQPDPGTSDSHESDGVQQAAPLAIAAPSEHQRAKVLRLKGIGTGEAGRRSRAITDSGRTIDSSTYAGGRVHLIDTLRAAAPQQQRRGRSDRMLVRVDDLRQRVTEGRESNLVLFAVDASGSMGARQRMSEVKGAVLSLLIDAYQRRDRVGVVAFRDHAAHLVLSATSSVEAAARCLTDLPHGGRTPLAEGLLMAARTFELEHIRDPRRRPLLVLITDGRATSGGDALGRARHIADHWRHTGVQAVVVDCESGRIRLGLAAELAQRMGAEHLPLEQVAAEQLAKVVRERRAA
ncbi:MAG: VWA domain-containing protein [Candidatus Nanopelagicales bacterium]